MKKLMTLCLLAVSLTATAQTHVFDVNTKKLGAPVQPTMYGIFFEDINYAADGGLYAEMVKNRSFEFPQRMMGWHAFGNFEVKKRLERVIVNPTTGQRMLVPPKLVVAFKPSQILKAKI